MRKLELDYVMEWSNSEPHLPWQNWTERCMRTLLSKARSLMDESGAPEESWGHAMTFAAWSLNHTAHRESNWRTPKESLAGDAPDISPLQFEFCKKVECSSPKRKFPATRKPEARHAGPTEHVGDALCFHLLLPNNKITSRSAVRP